MKRERVCVGEREGERETFVRIWRFKITFSKRIIPAAKLCNMLVSVRAKVSKCVRVRICWKESALNMCV